MAAEATEKMPRPATKVRRRPMRSAREPAIRTTDASASVYASTTHWRSAKLPPRSLRMLGKAVLTTVMSSSSMNVAMEAAPSIHHLRVIGISLLLGVYLSGNLVRVPYHLLRRPYQV